MAFKEVAGLDCDNATALGGINKKTGKKNPTKVEGYYLGSREFDSPKSKTGKAWIHVFQTQEGTIGVYGKTDLDRKIRAVTPGVMTRVTQNGMQATKNGDMYKFRVEVDSTNAIEVADLSESSANADDDDIVEPNDEEPGSYSADSTIDEEEDLDDSPADEPPPSRAAAPKKPAALPDAARRAKVQEILNRAGTRK